jgi:hypothetical protein
MAACQVMALLYATATAVTDIQDSATRCLEPRLSI